MSTTTQQEHAPAFLKERKMMLVLPLLVVPFTTFGFWTLGGGSGPGTEKKIEVQGINTELPAAANASDSTFDKMAFYKKAEQDSLERQRSIKNDPYYQNNPNAVNPYPVVGNGPFDANSNLPTYAPGNTSYNGYAYNDPNEKRLNDKLEQLNRALNAPPGSVSQGQPSNAASYGQNPGVTSSDIERLEKMMNAMQNSSPATEADPEMQQINNVLGQILDIQHPERVKDRLQENSMKNGGMVFPVTAVQNYDPVTLLSATKNAKDSGKVTSNEFFSFSEEVNSNSQNVITAAMHETQTLVDGSIVKLRLTNDVYVSGQLVPKDNFIFGVAQLQGERLIININSLRYGNAIFPVKLSVYDIDGLDGIHIPGAISRDVAKQSSERAIQSLGVTSLDPSMSAQAMGAGIEAFKSLLSKKVKLIKVTVKAGYQVLLKDANQQAK